VLYKNFLGRVKRLLNIAISSKRNRLISFVAVFALMGTSALAINYAIPNGPPCTSDHDFKRELNLGVACKVTGDLFAVKLADNSLLYTHGLDKFADTPDELVQAAKPVTRKAAAQYFTNTASAFASYIPPKCATDYYYEVIFAIPPGTPDRSASMLSAVRDVIGRANGFLQNEAKQFNIAMNYKFLCDSSGIVVTRVALNTSSTDFGDITSELKAKGFNRGNVKYVVWRDQTTYNSIGGLGSVIPDDRPTVDNPNNGNSTNPSFAIVYGQSLDSNNNPVPSSTAMLFAHEMTHNIGSVMTSAPNYSTSNLHCRDGDSLMCRYGGSTGDISGICTDRLYYDCGYNDYFNPKPAGASYLATHWNLATSINRFVTLTGLPTGNAQLTINISAPPTSGTYTSGNPTITASPHSLGDCGTSKAVPMSSNGTGTITCTSGPGYGIGSPDGTNVTAPTISGYTFMGWTGSSWSGPSCTNTTLAKCVNMVSGQSGTVTGAITATYKQNTTTATTTSLTINVNAPTPNGGYTGGNVTFSASPHGLGYCFNSVTVAVSTSSGTGSVTCTSAAGYGIGSPDGTNVKAPDIPGYYFTGWQGGSWSGTSCTNAYSDRCVNIPTGGAAGTITANYYPVQASLTVNTTSGIAAPITALNHSIGYCGFSFTAPRTCYSGPGYPIGQAADGVTTYIRAGAVAGYVFVGWSGGCSGTGDCPVSISKGSNMTVTANYQAAQVATLNIYLEGAPYTIYLGSSPHSAGYCGTNIAISPGTTVRCQSGAGYGIGIPDGTNITAPAISNYSVSWVGNAEYTGATSCSRTSLSLCVNLRPGDTASVTLRYTYVAPTTSTLCRSSSYVAALCIQVSGGSGSSRAYSTQHSVGTCVYSTYTWFYIPQKCEGNRFGPPDGLYIYADTSGGNFKNWWYGTTAGTDAPTNGSLWCYSTYCFVNFDAYNVGTIRANYY
jgi:uncharacterized repeat protein (TIGR02543 family)